MIEWIVADENIDKAIKAVKGNKGAPGIDKMPVGELDGYFENHREEIKTHCGTKSISHSQCAGCIYPKRTGSRDRWGYRQW